MTVPFETQPVRVVSDRAGGQWTVRVLRAGAVDPPAPFFIGGGYLLKMILRRLPYWLGRRHDRRVIVNPGREMAGGRYREPVLDEWYENQDSAVRRAEELCARLEHGQPLQ